MSEVFDDIIDRETDVARIAAVVASDFRFAYFGTAAFAVRLLRLDQKLMDGIPMNPRAGWLTSSTPRPNCCGDSVAISSRPATRRWCCTPMAGRLRYRLFEPPGARASAAR
jgi:hypothetical protein